MAASDEFGAFGSTRERLTADPFVAVTCARSRCGGRQQVDLHIDRAPVDLDGSKPPERLVQLDVATFTEELRDCPVDLVRDGYRIDDEADVQRADVGILGSIAGQQRRGAGRRRWSWRQRNRPGSSTARASRDRPRRPRRDRRVGLLRPNLASLAYSRIAVRRLGDDNDRRAVRNRDASHERSPVVLPWPRVAIRAGQFMDELPLVAGRDPLVIPRYCHHRCCVSSRASDRRQHSGPPPSALARTTAAAAEAVLAARTRFRGRSIASSSAPEKRHQRDDSLPVRRRPPARTCLQSSGSRSMLRTCRVRPASVRTTALGTTLPASRSMTAISPA